MSTVVYPGTDRLRPEAVAMAKHYGGPSRDLPKFRLERTAARRDSAGRLPAAGRHRRRCRDNIDQAQSRISGRCDSATVHLVQKLRFPGREVFVAPPLLLGVRDI